MASIRETSSPTTHHHGQLRRNASGLPAILFLLVTSAAPLYAMMFNVRVAINGSGFGAPSGFILAGIVVIVFAIGYVAMARRVTAAGEFYSFASMCSTRWWVSQSRFCSPSATWCSRQES